MQLYRRSIRLGLSFYKAVISPVFGARCRYLPTCSSYAASVLASYGPVRGSWLAAGRLFRCRPGGGFGYDPPPPTPVRKWKCEHDRV